jgi:phosphinothricin acetyltransferase
MGAAPIPWIVADEEGVVGFASAAPFRSRAAYGRTAEASIYVSEAARGNGVGRSLGEAILRELGAAGYHSVIGVVALPNPASERLLQALGFQVVGTIREAGFKLDRWWDVQLWQRVLE